MPVVRALFCPLRARTEPISRLLADTRGHHGGGEQVSGPYARPLISRIIVRALQARGCPGASRGVNGLFVAWPKTTGHLKAL